MAEDSATGRKGSLQFSLKTLLLAVVIIAVLLGQWTWAWREVQQARQRAVAAQQEMDAIRVEAQRTALERELWIQKYNEIERLIRASRLQDPPILP